MVLAFEEPAALNKSLLKICFSTSMVLTLVVESYLDRFLNRQDSIFELFCSQNGEVELLKMVPEAFLTPTVNPKVNPKAIWTLFGTNMGSFRGHFGNILRAFGDKSSFIFYYLQHVISEDQDFPSSSTCSDLPGLAQACLTKLPIARWIGIVRRHLLAQPCLDLPTSVVNSSRV